MTGGYSTGLVARILTNWPALAGPEGRLPAPQWVLAVRGRQRRYGGASYELPAVYRSDIERGLRCVSPTAAKILQARMCGATERGLARLLDCSPATAQRRLDDAIEELTAVLNRGGAVAETNGILGMYDVAWVSLLTVMLRVKT